MSPRRFYCSALTKASCFFSSKLYNSYVFVLSFPFIDEMDTIFVIVKNKLTSVLSVCALIDDKISS